MGKLVGNAGADEKLRFFCLALIVGSLAGCNTGKFIYVFNFLAFSGVLTRKLHIYVFRTGCTNVFRTEHFV